MSCAFTKCILFSKLLNFYHESHWVNTFYVILSLRVPGRKEFAYSFSWDLFIMMITICIINLVRPLSFNWASLVAQMVKHLPAMWETQVRSLGWEDLLEKEMATHCSILAWRIPRTEEPGRLQSMGSQRVGHDWVISLSLSLSFNWYVTSFIVWALL